MTASRPPRRRARVCMLCLVVLALVGCEFGDIINQPLKMSQKTSMRLTSNVPDTRFRIREQQIDAGPEEGWTDLGQGLEITAEAHLMGRYEIAAKPAGYAEKRVRLTEPVKTYDFRFVGADRTDATAALPVTPGVAPGTIPGVTPGPAGDPPAAIRNVHVLVIGIGRYKDPSIPRLKYTAADARAIYEWFRQSPKSFARPENVHFVGDTPNEDGIIADKRGIMLALSKYIIKKAVHNDDLVILYYSGHGDSGRHPTKGTEYYLIPIDAEQSDLFATAIELSEFQRLWTAIPARTKILVADACNSGGFSGLKAIGGTVGLETVKGEAKAVFSACKSDERSMELDSLKHGLFTHVLLEGIDGKADAAAGDGDGRVTLSELKRWLDSQVPVRARQHGGTQTPVTSLVEAWGEVYLTK